MIHITPLTRWIARLSLAALLGLCLAPAQAERAEPLPRELEGVGIFERLDDVVPMHLDFVDDEGSPVELSRYFHQGRPVILMLNYYTCPMLCGLQLNGFVDVLREMKWTPGQEFEVVTVSIDPRDTPTLAGLKKKNYIAELGRGEAAAGWHFLTGEEESIITLADAVGFGYKWNEAKKEYAHSAALILCTPDGRIARYLYGILYDMRTLRMSLLEAGEGKIGTPLDQIILYCFHYNAADGRYAPVAMNIMRAGGALTATTLIGVLAVLWTWDLRRRKTLMRRDPLH